LTVQLVAADDSAPSTVALDAVIAGQADMGHGPVQALQARSEALPFFSSIPFGLTAMEMTTWLDQLGGQVLSDAVHDTFGVQAMLCGDTGPQSGGWFRTPLAGIEDVQGLRLLSSGLPAQVWRKMGLSPVAMAADETLAGLQAGALDGIEFAGPARDLDMGYHQACKHYVALSFTKPALASALVIDKDSYLALPQSLRAVLRGSCAAAHRDSLAAQAARDAAALHSLTTTYGVTVYPAFPDSILQAGGKAASEIITALRDSSDPLARRTAESYVAALIALKQKADGADTAYQAARARFLQL
jgi:TRAP-type mannitol/chloroaromatic compound transport system substrate-binding protein